VLPITIPCGRWWGSKVERKTTCLGHEGLRWLAIRVFQKWSLCKQ